jgi:hypothetical protein
MRYSLHKQNIKLQFSFEVRYKVNRATFTRMGAPQKTGAIDLSRQAFEMRGRKWKWNRSVKVVQTLHPAQAGYVRWFWHRECTNRVTHLFLLQLSFSLRSDASSRTSMLVHALDAIQLRIFSYKKLTLAQEMFLIWEGSQDRYKLQLTKHRRHYVACFSTTVAV